MKILIYGAGPLGSLYAARLKEAGNDVAILARGARLAALREKGIILKDEASGSSSTVKVDVVESLEPGDAYDLVMVIMAKHHLGDVLPVLAANTGSPDIMFMCNNAAGPDMMVDALGPDRVLLGFAGAAGYFVDDILKFVIVPRREQPTTIGELDGKTSDRLKRIRDTLEGAGFPAAVSNRMDDWLKTHVAEVAPVAAAIYMEDGSLERLAASDRALNLLIAAIRENFSVLRSAGIPITPGSHSVFRWIPVPMLRGLMRKQLQDDLMEYKVGHARASSREWVLLIDELRGLNRSGISTPAMDELYQHISAASDKQAGKADR